MINVVITLINSAYGLPNKETTILSERAPVAVIALPESEPLSPSHPMVELPPIGKVERDKIEFIFNTLATKSYFEILRSYKELAQLREELKDLHPFQSLEVIFEVDSPIKNYMPTIINSWKIGSRLVEEFSKKMEMADHKKMTASYVDSFSKKVNTTPEAISSRLGSISDLIEHLIEKNCEKKTK